MSEQNTPDTQPTTLLLTPQFKSLRPGQTGHLSIINRGTQTELVTLRAEAPADVVSLTFHEPTVAVSPNQHVEIEVRVNRVSYLVHPAGKSFSVPVRADTSTANTAVTDITVELRPRYEWLSPLLFLLCAATTFFVLPTLLSSTAQPIPTNTPTHVPTLTPTLSVTPSPTLTSSPTFTPSLTFTPNPTPCDSFQCHCESQGGFVYTVRPNDWWGYIFQSPNPKNDPRILLSAQASGVDISSTLQPKQELCLLGIDPDKIPGPNDDQQTQTHNSTLTAAITIDGGITPVCGEPFNVTVILTNTGRTALTGGTLNFRDLHPASGNERSNMSAQFPILNPGQQSPPIHFTGVMTDIHYNEQHKLQAIVDGQVIGELSYVLQQGNCNPTINNVITPVPVTVPIVVNFSYDLNDITCGDGLYTIALTNLTTGAVSYQWAIEYYEVRVFRNQNGGFDHASPGTAFVSREVFSTETNPILTIKDVYRNGGFNIKVILTAYSNVGSPKSYSEDIIGQWLGWNGCAVAH